MKLKVLSTSQLKRYSLGNTGQALYSHDHYNTFIEIGLGGWK